MSGNMKVDGHALIRGDKVKIRKSVTRVEEEEVTVDYVSVFRDEFSYTKADGSHSIYYDWDLDSSVELVKPRREPGIYQSMYGTPYVITSDGRLYEYGPSGCMLVEDVERRFASMKLVRLVPESK